MIRDRTKSLNASSTRKGRACANGSRRSQSRVARSSAILARGGKATGIDLDGLRTPSCCNHGAERGSGHRARWTRCVVEARELADPGVRSVEDTFADRPGLRQVAARVWFQEDWVEGRATDVGLRTLVVEQCLAPPDLDSGLGRSKPVGPICQTHRIRSILLTCPSQ